MIVFGSVIKKFIFGHNFRYRKYHRFGFGFVHAACKFISSHKLLDEHLFAFRKGFSDGGLNVGFFLHFRYSETASSHVWFDKAGQSDFLDYFIVGYAARLAQQNRFCHANSESFQVLIAGEFIERESRYEYIAGGVRYSQQVKISLQDAVFARSAVNSDIGKVKHCFLFSDRKAEIVFVNRVFFRFRKFNLPQLTYNGY